MGVLYPKMNHGNGLWRGPAGEAGPGSPRRLALRELVRASSAVGVVRSSGQTVRTVREPNGQGKPWPYGMMMRVSMLAACGLIASSLALAAPTPKPGMMLYVTNSGSGDVTVIDLGSLKVVGDIQVGAAVHGAAMEADGRKLFTSIESNNTLSVVNTATNKIEATIKLTGRPNQCAVTPDGRYVGVPIRDGNGVDIVDVAQSKVVKTLP